MPMSKKQSVRRTAESRACGELSPQCRLGGLWVSIDPGVHTGYAVWTGAGLRTTGVVCEPDIDERFEGRLRRLVCTLRDTLPLGMLAAHIEGVEHHGSAAGIAAERSGSTQKLAYIVGAITYMLEQRGTRVTLHRPSMWKGQMTDSAVDLRVHEELGARFRRHEVEAVGLGLWALGRWL
jgi:hypothetical protein